MVPFEYKESGAHLSIQARALAAKLLLATQLHRTTILPAAYDSVVAASPFFYLKL
jgi:hypothetical protein